MRYQPKEMKGSLWRLYNEEPLNFFGKTWHVFLQVANETSRIILRHSQGLLTSFVFKFEGLLARRMAYHTRELGLTPAYQPAQKSPLKPWTFALRSNRTSAHSNSQTAWRECSNYDRLRSQALMPGASGHGPMPTPRSSAVPPWPEGIPNSAWGFFVQEATESDQISRSFKFHPSREVWSHASNCIFFSSLCFISQPTGKYWPFHPPHFAPEWLLPRNLSNPITAGLPRSSSKMNEIRYDFITTVFAVLLTEESIASVGSPQPSPLLYVMMTSRRTMK